MFLILRFKKIKRLIAAAHTLYYCFTRYSFDHENMQKAVIGVAAALEDIDPKKYSETHEDAIKGYIFDHGVKGSNDGKKAEAKKHAP